MLDTPPTAQDVYVDIIQGHRVRGIPTGDSRSLHCH